METRVVENPAADRYEIHVDGEVAGLISYRRHGATLSLDHTEIEPRFEGKGLGSVLVRGALDAIRADGAQALPYCPFIRRYIQRHPGYADVVPADHRATFDLPS